MGGACVTLSALRHRDLHLRCPFYGSAVALHCFRGASLTSFADGSDTYKKQLHVFYSDFIQTSTGPHICPSIFPSSLVSLPILLNCYIWDTCLELSVIPSRKPNIRYALFIYITNTFISQLQ